MSVNKELSGHAFSWISSLFLHRVGHWLTSCDFPNKMANVLIPLVISNHLPTMNISSSITDCTVSMSCMFLLAIWIHVLVTGENKSPLLLIGSMWQLPILFPGSFSQHIYMVSNSTWSAIIWNGQGDRKGNGNTRWAMFMEGEWAGGWSREECG